MADVPVLAPAAEDASGKKKSKWLIIGLVAAVVLVGGGVGAFFLWPQADAHSKQAQEKAKEPLTAPLYVPLDPPFVVNFEGDPLVRFLQVAAQVMTRDPETVALLKANDPAVRNDLLLLLGNQKSAELGTREGKEHLRAEALAAIRHVIETAGGKPDKVEAIYFTSFVMQ